jgi:hypothetical protein
MREKLLARKQELLAAGVPAGIVLAVVLGTVATGLVRPKPLTAQEIVAKDLGWANQECSAGINPRLNPVRELFGQARQGVRAFADDALGWESKFRLLTGYLSSGDEHGNYLRQQFSAHIFSQHQLESAVEAAVGGYMKHLEDVDAQLLVRLQADLCDVPTEQLSPGIDRNAIRQLLDEALREARKAAESDFRGMIGREIVSLVAGEVLSAVAVQLATSTGILGAGAASGTVTFGAGLVVGFIADYAVSWTYDKLYDPIGQLSNQINQQLDQLEQMIIVGSGKQPGLQKRLQDYSLRRSKARDAAIRAAIFPSAQVVGL